MRAGSRATARETLRTRKFRVDEMNSSWRMSLDQDVKTIDVRSDWRVHSGGDVRAVVGDRDTTDERRDWETDCSELAVS